MGIFDAFLFEKAPPNSARVTKDIRRLVWPYLKGVGFTRFSPRTAWRRWKDGVDIVNLRSITVLPGVPPTSFGMNIAVYYPASRVAEEVLRYPAESHGDARRSVFKSLKQDMLPRPDVWWVERDGSNSREAVEDALAQLRVVAPSWFEEFHDLGRAVDAFANREDTFLPRGIAQEMIGGTLGSPHRVRVLKALEALRQRPAG